jgi:MFS family permease
VDLVLRLLVIEKKIAKLYQQPSTNGTNTPSQPDSHSNLPASEVTPLLNDIQGEDSTLARNRQNEDLTSFIIPPNQNALIRQAPILACLKNLSLLTAFLVGFMQASILGAFDATIPTIAVEYYNFTSLRAGLLFLALGIPTLLLGPVAGWAVDRFGTKPAATLGFTYITPVIACLRFVEPGGTPQVRVYAVILALCGVGLAAIDAPSIVEAGLVVEKYHKANPDFFGINGPYAQLYGLNSMVFSAGFTLGPLIAGSLKDSIGYGNMNTLLAGATGITALLSFLFIGGRPNLGRRGWGLRR